MTDQFVSLRAVLEKTGRADYNCQSMLTRDRCMLEQMRMPGSVILQPIMITSTCTEEA